MLKGFVFLFYILIFGFFILTTRVYSQEPPQETVIVTYDDVYAEYTGSIEEYNKAHAEYILRRAQYLKFQSLKSRQDAYNATLIMLEKRDDIVISYLNVLRKKIEEGIGISDTKKESLFLSIEEEIDWFSNHKDNLSTTGSLNDLVSDSKLAADRWLKITPLAYEVMAVLSQGKVTNFDSRIDDVFSETKKILDIVRNDNRDGYSFSSYKLQILDRWIFEADGKIARSRTKQSEADVLIIEMTTSKKKVTDTYSSIISKLTESQLYMKETNLFLKEIVKQIKTEE